MIIPWLIFGIQWDIQDETELKFWLKVFKHVQTCWNLSEFLSAAPGLPNHVGCVDSPKLKSKAFQTKNKGFDFALLLLFKNITSMNRRIILNVCFEIDIHENLFLFLGGKVRPVKMSHLIKTHVCPVGSLVLKIAFQNIINCSGCFC